jgi:hypothetical protein
VTGDTPLTVQPNDPVDPRAGLRAGLRRPAVWLSATAAALVLVALVIVLASRGGPRPPRATAMAGPSATQAQVQAPAQAATPPVTGEPGPSSSRPGNATCPAPTVTVRDADSLTAALAAAAPGTSIWMQDGVYGGRFKATTSGTANSPIFLCGGARAVIDGGSVKGGYALHLDGASYWRVVGFGVRNGQKGLMADRVQHVVIQGLTVEQIGDEAIHLRNFSSDNVVQGNTVRKTGLRRDQFGEGIYLGTAQSNWCTVTDCKPDMSDRNTVRGNDISGTTAESVDIKEGTSGGVLSGNTFDGAALSGSHADSWVDVKGNGWMIEGNVGRNAREDGFQTHEVVAGWGTNNSFKANTAEVNGPGWGFHFAPANANKVSCDNKVTGAAKGLANVDCG